MKSFGIHIEGKVENKSRSSNVTDHSEDAKINAGNIKAGKAVERSYVDLHVGMHVCEYVRMLLKSGWM